MALNRTKLVEDIVKIQKEMLSKEQPDFELYAQKLATAIEQFVKSGEVVVEKGISVQAGSYTGVTTGTGKGKMI